MRRLKNKNQKSQKYASFDFIYYLPGSVYHQCMEEGHLQLYTVYSTMYIYTVPAQAALTYGAWHVKLATFIVFFHTHKKY